MKKILFGSAAAICAVAGLSSFKAIQAQRYWFKVNPNISVGNPVTAGDVTYIGLSDPGTSSADCPRAILTHNKCYITVTVGKVTTTNHTHLKSSVSVSNGTRYTRTVQ